MTNKTIYENNTYRVYVSDPVDGIGTYCVQSVAHEVVELRTSVLVEAISMADELENQLDMLNGSNVVQEDTTKVTLQ